MRISVELAAADVGAAGAGYQVSVLIYEAVLDDYEGHVSCAAGLTVYISKTGGAGEGVAGTDGEKGLDPLAGHVDGAIELEVEVGGFFETDEGSDEGGRGDDVAVGATGGGFLVDKEGVGLSDGP